MKSATFVVLLSLLAAVFVHSSQGPQRSTHVKRQYSTADEEDCVLLPKTPISSRLAGGLCINPINKPMPSENKRRRRKKGHDIIDVSKLPKNFFWGDINGVNYLTVARNQHIPQYCGSCWAFGTLSAVNDRIKIQRRNAHPEINLAPQVLINCNGGGSCYGGRMDGVLSYLVENGLPDETCQNYKAKNGKCDPHGVCEKCLPADKDPTLNKHHKKKHSHGHKLDNTDDCVAVEDYRLYYISDYGNINNAVDRDLLPTKRVTSVQKIMAEIYARGPVACTIFATQKFDDYTGGIFSQFTLRPGANHVISLVGWGEEDGEKYWIGRNSWGTYWGENGFFRISRPGFLYGLGVDSNCVFADPIIPDELAAEDPLPENKAWGEFLLDYHAKKDEEHVVEAVQNRKKRHHKKQHHKQKQKRVPQDLMEIPESYDIRDIDGVSFASIDRNQNSPEYCDASWAHAATSALNDRFALLRPFKHPEIVLSPQVLLNCVGKYDGCLGGNPGEAYDYIKKNSIPDESCAVYEAKTRVCDPIHICKTCWPAECHAMTNSEYTPYWISDHGKVSGDLDVQTEIFQNGPVVCRICESEKFSKYTRGILKDMSKCDLESSKSFVVLSGWGKEGGASYWIGRNSWGTYWGENGWFRLNMGKRDLRVTEDCYWATPEIPKYRYIISTRTSKVIPVESKPEIKPAL